MECDTTASPAESMQVGGWQPPSTPLSAYFIAALASSCGLDLQVGHPEVLHRLLSAEGLPALLFAPSPDETISSLELTSAYLVLQRIFDVLDAGKFLLLCNSMLLVLEKIESLEDVLNAIDTHVKERFGRLDHTHHTQCIIKPRGTQITSAAERTLFSTPIQEYGRDSVMGMLHRRASLELSTGFECAVALLNDLPALVSLVHAFLSVGAAFAGAPGEFVALLNECMSRGPTQQFSVATDLIASIHQQDNGATPGKTRARFGAGGRGSALASTPAVATQLFSSPILAAQAPSAVSGGRLTARSTAPVATVTTLSAVTQHGDRVVAAVQSSGGESYPGEGVVCREVCYGSADGAAGRREHHACPLTARQAGHPILLALAWERHCSRSQTDASGTARGAAAGTMSAPGSHGCGRQDANKPREARARYVQALESACYNTAVDALHAYFDYSYGSSMGGGTPFDGDTTPLSLITHASAPSLYSNWGTVRELLVSAASAPAVGGSALNRSLLHYPVFQLGTTELFFNHVGEARTAFHEALRCAQAQGDVAAVVLISQLLGEVEVREREGTTGDSAFGASIDLRPGGAHADTSVPSGFPHSSRGVNSSTLGLGDGEGGASLSACSNGSTNGRSEPVYQQASRAGMWRIQSSSALATFEDGVVDHTVPLKDWLSLEPATSYRLGGMCVGAPAAAPREYFNAAFHQFFKAPLSGTQLPSTSLPALSHYTGSLVEAAIGCDGSIPPCVSVSERAGSAAHSPGRVGSGSSEAFRFPSGLHTAGGHHQPTAVMNATLSTLASAGRRWRALGEARRRPSLGGNAPTPAGFDPMGAVNVIGAAVAPPSGSAVLWSTPAPLQLREILRIQEAGHDARGRAWARRGYTALAASSHACSAAAFIEAVDLSGLGAHSRTSSASVPTGDGAVGCVAVQVRPPALSYSSGLVGSVGAKLLTHTRGSHGVPRPVTPLVHGEAAAAVVVEAWRLMHGLHTGAGCGESGGTGPGRGAFIGDVDTEASRVAEGLEPLHKAAGKRISDALSLVCQAFHLRADDLSVPTAFPLDGGAGSLQLLHTLLSHETNSHLLRGALLTLLATGLVAQQQGAGDPSDWYSALAPQLSALMHNAVATAVEAASRSLRQCLAAHRDETSVSEGDAATLLLSELALLQAALALAPRDDVAFHAHFEATLALAHSARGRAVVDACRLQIIRAHTLRAFLYLEEEADGIDSSGDGGERCASTDDFTVNPEVCLGTTLQLAVSGESACGVVEWAVARAALLLSKGDAGGARTTLVDFLPVILHHGRAGAVVAAFYLLRAAYRLTGRLVPI